MFNVSLIKAELTDIVGFRQPVNPKYAIVDIPNQVSKSGLYVTDNPYAKIEYIKENIDYSKITTEDFNKTLKNIKETSSISICSQVFIEDDFIDRNLIYTNSTNKVETVNLPQGFVGYKITVDDKKNLGFRINRAILEFEEAGTIDLLVFNSNIKQPIQTIPITYDEFYHMETLDIVIDNVGFYRGLFYVGFVSDGSVNAFRRNFDNNRSKNEIKYISIDTQVVPDFVGPNIFNLDEAKSFSEYCGFNLDITVVEDFTDFIMNNKYLFGRAIYLDCIISCLNIYAATLRSNSQERSADELYSRIMLEIEGTRPDDNVIHVRGLRNEMIYEISQVRDQLLKLKGGFFGKGFFVDTQD